MEPPLSTSYFDNLALLINQADLDEEGRERAANFAGMLSANNSILHFVSELGISLPQILRWLRSPFLHLDVGGIKQLQALQLDLHTQAAALDAIHCLREICNSDAPVLQRRLAATKILALNEPAKQPATRELAPKLASPTKSSPVSTPTATSTDTPSHASTPNSSAPSSQASAKTNQSAHSEEAPTHTPHHPETPVPTAKNPQNLAATQIASSESIADTALPPITDHITPEAAQPAAIEQCNPSIEHPIEHAVAHSAPTEACIPQSPIIADTPEATTSAPTASSDSIATEPTPDSQAAADSINLAPPAEAPSHNSQLSRDPQPPPPTNSASSPSDEHARIDPQDRRPEPEVPRENPGLPLPPRIYSYRRGYPVRN